MSLATVPLFRISVFVLLLAGVATLATVQAQSGESEERDAVCHLPGGDTAKARTIQGDADGLAEHLAHGDSEGECDFAALTGAEQVVPEGHVLICHVPGGNPANAHELVLSEAAADDHIAHGDEFGHCASFGATSTIEPRVAGPTEGETVCHKGRTRMVAADALESHTGHGDTLGTC